MTGQDIYPLEVSANKEIKKPVGYEGKIKSQTLILQ